MWKLRVVMFLLVLSICSAACGEENKQQKQGGQYVVYIVENLSPSKLSEGHIPIAATGSSSNYILLDTATGKTWILTNIGAPFKDEDGKERVLESYGWEPLFFKTEETSTWQKSWGKGKLSVAPK